MHVLSEESFTTAVEPARRVMQTATDLRRREETFNPYREVLYKIRHLRDIYVLPREVRTANALLE